MSKFLRHSWSEHALRKTAVIDLLGDKSMGVSTARRRGGLLASLGAASLWAASPAAAADQNFQLPRKAPVLVNDTYNWTGWYVGVHTGDAWGKSNWSKPPDQTGSLNLFQRYDAFATTGSYFGGFQFGYDYMLPNRVVIGGVVDTSFPSFPDFNGLTIGGTSIFVSPILGQEAFSETVLSFGTVRGRVGYAPGNWLIYATGGFAWTYNQLSVIQLDNNNWTDAPFLWRFGWTAGAGVEVPLLPNWTTSLEYRYTGYGNSNVGFANAGQ